jgi:phenylalanyl-tRNA synthetase alpha subunit
MNTINYRNIADSIDFYEKRGFSYIETPWYVTKEVMDATKPSFIKEGDDYYIPKNDKYLVASAEQSFLYLMFKGQLLPGTYQSVTPCYRFEPIDSIHRKVFMKNELIHIMKKDDTEGYLRSHLKHMIDMAQEFFEKVIKDNVTQKEVAQENSIVNFDLMYKGYELGSYGIRRFKNLSQWIYGTGCAEPRLSLIKKI